MPRPIHYRQGAGVDPNPPQHTIEDVFLAKRHETLRETILDNMGVPDDLIKIDVKILWDHNHYRINVYREIKGSPRITDSYFVYMVDDGVISSPPIDRIYHDDILRSYHEDGKVRMNIHRRREED